ncbi:hypothetical protein Tco_1285861 [Tanacetum coccineum]
MQAARDRQKSYADKRRRPLEFEVGDKVMLKVAPWKGVMRFGKRGKLNPRYIGPFRIIERIGPVAYRLDLPQELSRVHNVFPHCNLNNLLQRLDFEGGIFYPREVVEPGVGLRRSSSQVQILPPSLPSHHLPTSSDLVGSPTVETMYLPLHAAAILSSQESGEKHPITQISTFVCQGLECTQVVQELGENSGDKRKWNGNHYSHNPNNTNNTSDLNPNKRPETTRVFTRGAKVLMGLASLPHCRNVDATTLTHALLLVTTVERQDIRPKTAELHLVPQPKEDQEAKEDRKVMSLVSDVAKKDIIRTSVRTMGIKAVETKFEATRKTLRTIRGRIMGTLREVTNITSTQGGLIAPATIYNLCAEASV